MDIHIRFDDSNQEHTRSTIFINGRNCGQLTMGTDEMANFYMLVENGCHRVIDTFRGTGKLYPNYSEDDFNEKEST